MKQLYLLSLLLLFASNAFSQQKFEFGFVVKAGTFTLPHKKQIGELNTYSYPAGFSSSYGLFVSRRLGGHFRLSLDLLYNFSQYREIINGIDYTSSFFPAPMERRVLSTHAHSFIVPLQIHFLPKKDGKIALSGGAALSGVLSSGMNARFEKSTQQVIVMELDDPVKKYRGYTVFQTFYTAGVHYKSSPKTFIGLEFMGLLHRGTPFIFLPVHSHLTNEKATPFWMQSLAISVRHNILR